MGSPSKRLKKTGKKSRKMKKQVGGQAVPPPMVVSPFAGSTTATPVANPVVITAGDTTTGPATNATFNQPSGGVFDSVGNMYVADTLNHKIRRITRAGVVTTIAGTGVATQIVAGAIASTLGDFAQRTK